MSFGQDSAANRKTALEQLKFKKVQRAAASTASSITPSPSLPSGRSRAGSNALPSQSRDATMSSRWFATPASPNATILVPNSSPSSSLSSSYRAHHQPRPDLPNDVAHIPGLYFNPWTQSTRQATDSLSTPSGFVAASAYNHATSSRSTIGIVRGRGETENSEESEPPRKRLNHGSPSLDSFHIPSSPDVQPLGQRRNRAPEVVPGRRSGVQSLSSDESMLESHELPTLSSRIARGTRPDAHVRHVSGNSTFETDAPQFRMFRMTFPEYEEMKVRAAWKQAGGEEKAAIALLRDPDFNPNPPSASSLTTTPPMTGRVKELVDGTKAERALVKQKGKKSLIYAGRLELDAEPVSRKNTPPPSKRTSSLPPSPASPQSPDIAPRTRRLKRKIIESDEESEAELSSADERRQKRRAQDSSPDERRALNYFNTTGSEGLQELTGCTVAQADSIITLRPFSSVEDVKNKLGQGKKKAGPAGLSARLFDDCVRIFHGYGTVDNVLEECERIGAKLNAAIAKWTVGAVKGKEKEGSSMVSPDLFVALSEDSYEEGALNLRTLGALNNRTSKDFLLEQPRALSVDTKLKDYQLTGLNWLRLLYNSGYSCILADEMGLGKTVQVISFLAHLKDQGTKGPHLIVVPSSTLENWVREFKRFAPSISVQTYYGSKNDRQGLRDYLNNSQRKVKEKGWEVLLTTYNLATGDDKDRKFFRHTEWDTCIFDEGHILKNFDSQRYRALMKNRSKWRLLLTGTPLQNNLQELVSLMNFILPDLLAASLDSLRDVFKTKGDSKITLLARERVSRAKRMLTPFVMRRRKDQVLKDLPQKFERIEWCEMTTSQRSIYDDALQRSRKTIFDLETPTPGTETPPTTNGRSKAVKKIKTNPRPKDKLYLENSSNVLMDLRKAASHPMLFRTIFTDQTLDAITKLLLKEPEFQKRGATAQFVKEDMEVMTDAELQDYLATYRSTRKFLQKEDCFLQAGKVQVLLKLLDQYRAEKRRILIFSQFVQILDILQAVFKHKKIKYLVLTGSTAVDVRQSLVDEFNENEEITVFLLSTKAGGMGINLTAASVVVIFDQDFNPHNDKQAQDRAYRIGQKRDVDIVKLITRGTIEEDMLRLGQTKLALDEAVAGEASGGDSGENMEREMKTSLMSALRKQLANKNMDEGTKDGSDLIE